MPTQPRLRAALLCAFLAVGLASCDVGPPSTVDDHATVRVAARILTPDGKPAAGVRVRVHASRDGSDALAHFATFPIPFPDAKVFGDTDRTDEQGNASFTGSGSSTKTPHGNARLMILTVDDGASHQQRGALGRGGVMQSFFALSDHVALPDVPLWNPRVRLTIDGPDLQVRYDPIQDTHVTYTWQVTDLQGNPLGEGPLQRTGGRIDGRLLEDIPGRLSIVASRVETGDSHIETLWQSATYPVRGQLRPPSRDARCWDPTVTPHVVGQCGLTDGDLTTPGPSVAGVIDLGSVRRIHLVVLRGLTYNADVLGSVDGSKFSFSSLTEPTWKQPLEPAFVRVIPVSASVRFLHVGDSLTEVGVW